MTDNKQDDHTGIGFVAGMVIGGLLGAAASYLIGGEDREAAKKKIKKMGKVLWDNMEDAGEKIGEKGEEIMDSVEDLKDSVVEKVEVLEEKAEELPKKTRKFFLKKGKPLLKK